MLEGIAESITKAEGVQERFNALSPRKRFQAFMRHPQLMATIQSKYRLECQCVDCSAIMDSFHVQVDGEGFTKPNPCVKCGSFDIASPYYT